MIQSLAVFLILFYSTLAVGNQILRFFKTQFVGGLEELVFSYGLGLLLLSELVLGLGIFGYLEKKWLWAGVGILGLIGASRVPRLLSCLIQREERESGGRLTAFLEIVFLLLVLVIGLWALVPPFGTDALAYHLSTPVAFLRMKKVDFIVDDVNSLFPFFTEMLFMLGVALQDVTVAQLFHWSLGVLAGFSLISFFKRFFVSRLWGTVAAIFFILTPGIFNQTHLALVDVAWTAYGFLSFYALIVGILEKEKGWLLLSFVLLGVALGIKYLAGLSAVAMAVAFVVFCLQMKWESSRILQWAVLGTGAVLLVSGYWYLKAYLVHGNPFYPYFNSLVGLETLYTSGAHVVEQYAHKVGTGKTILDLLTFPFFLTFSPTRYDGWGEQLGAAYLVFLPFVFYGRPGGVRPAIGLYAAIFTLGWFCLAQVSRFLYPCLPFIVVLIVSGLLFFYQKASRTILVYVTAILVSVLGVNTLLLGYHARESISYLLGREERHVFLKKRERSYEMAQFINENISINAKILNAEEVRMFYFNRYLVRESGYRSRTKYDETRGLNQVLDRLKREGFTHLLITRFGSNENGLGIRRWIGISQNQRGILRLYKTSFRERGGRQVEYAIYQLL